MRQPQSSERPLLNYSALVFLLLSVCCAIFSFCLSSALADEAGNGLNNKPLYDLRGDGSVGSTSNLVSATMQTAGVYAQAQILKDFTRPLTSLSALFYLVAIIGAIASTAIFGTYRKALYLLIGPTFFYFALTVTAPVDGTQSQMGKHVIGSISDKKKAISEYLQSERLPAKAEVSYIYLAVDNLVSSVVQTINGVLLNTENKEEIVIKAREQVLIWGLTATPNDNELASLISAGYLGECAKVTNIISDARRYKRDPTKSASADNFTEKGKEELARFNELKKTTIITLDTMTRERMKDFPNLWTNQAEGTASCEQIWEMIREIAFEHAEKYVDSRGYYATGPRDPDYPYDDIQAEYLRTLMKAAQDGNRSAKPEDILAAYILRNMLQRTQHQMMVQNIFDRAPFNAARRSGVLGDIAGVESYGGYMRIAYFAAAIPYIQGLLLYLLSAAFPFFALFLVMPSRAYTFLTWIGLWTWVKSWDVGFAMVDVVRKIMWQYVQKAPNAYSESIDWSFQESILSLIGNNDPMASLNTYFTVIAMLTTSVPLITAYFCLGATNLYSPFRMSIDGTATRFGQYRAAGERRFLASQGEELMRRQLALAQQTGAEQAGQIWDSDGELLTQRGQDLKAKNPGATIDSKHYLQQRGDNSRLYYMKMAAAKAGRDYWWSKEGVANAAWLAALTGRRTTNSYGAGKSYAQIFNQHLNFSFAGVPIGQGGTTFGSSGNDTRFYDFPEDTIITPTSSPDGGGE